MITRETLHGMVDDLPDHLLDAAGRSLARVAACRADAIWRALEEAPVDDEELTPEDIAAIEAGRRSMREGRGISTRELEELLPL